MTALKRACKIARRRVLLSAREEAYDWIRRVGPTPSEAANYDLTLAKLEVEIDWVRLKIQKLEAK